MGLSISWLIICRLLIEIFKIIWLFISLNCIRSSCLISLIVRIILRIIILCSFCVISLLLLSWYFCRLNLIFRIINLSILIIGYCSFPWSNIFSVNLGIILTFEVVSVGFITNNILIISTWLCWLLYSVFFHKGHS
mgnify:CR=1 FL=1